MGLFDVLLLMFFLLTLTPRGVLTPDGSVILCVLVVISDIYDLQCRGKQSSPKASSRGT